MNQITAGISPVFVRVIPRPKPRYSDKDVFGYRPNGSVVRLRSPRWTGPTYIVAGTACRCGYGRRFVWEAGRELCDQCAQPPRVCACAPLWAEQIGIVREVRPMDDWTPQIVSLNG